MKNNSIIKISIALALCVLSLSSCVREPEFNIKSEVTVPNGAVNYFENEMDFDYEGGEKTLSFSCNIRWSIKVAETQNGVQWLTVTPTAGSRGSQRCPDGKMGRAFTAVPEVGDGRHNRAGCKRFCQR